MRRPYSPRGADRLGDAGEQGAQGAGRREEVRGLALAAAYVGADAHADVVRLRPLQYLALAEADGRRAQEVDGGGVARAHQLGEGAGQQVVAGGDGHGAAVLVSDGRAAAPELGTVQDVVVHERRHVEQFDRGGRTQHRLARRHPAPGAEQREQRPDALAAGGEGGSAGLAELAGILGRHGGQALLDEVEAAGDAALLRRRGPAERWARSALVAGCGGTSPT